MTILELADACERAKGADGLLDVAIGNACGFRSHGDGYGAPPFTGSLDAAMRLVPEGVSWEMSVGDSTSAPFAFSCCIDRRFEGRNASPALALVAAALRARHAMESE